MEKLEAIFHLTDGGSTSLSFRIFACEHVAHNWKNIPIVFYEDLLERPPHAFVEVVQLVERLIFAPFNLLNAIAFDYHQDGG